MHRESIIERGLNLGMTTTSSIVFHCPRRLLLLPEPPETIQLYMMEIEDRVCIRKPTNKRK